MPYIWQHDSWPEFSWQDDRLIHAIGQARLAQGKLLSKVQALGIELSREAQAEILTEETIKTAAIEGENLDKNYVRSSVARRLGLPIAGLPHTARHIDGLVEVLLDATAYREISHLVNERILAPNPGKGRNISYHLVLND